ncbi:hypothetical protein E2C01_036869 [Portunus trituberculatus]|uniref:Uncharacterized protein n=1 Tax=Portunus trituberculatus TaxID=210409 RepID=A0A5B7FD82_PORTR|nr:hypothetical protein [Portunus trituberculatus]
MWAFHRNLWAKDVILWGTSYLKGYPLGNRCPRVRKPILHSDNAQDSVRLETTRPPKHAWFYCPTAEATIRATEPSWPT